MYCLFFTTAVTIGFRPDTYQVDEGAEFVELVVEVLDGILDTDVVVRFTTSDNSAICKGKLPWQSEHV